ncbi:MAG: peptidoglycan DD-metalloendopeptidase family protein [Alphaproteobacteria bacterium]
MRRERLTLVCTLLATCGLFFAASVAQAVAIPPIYVERTVALQKNENLVEAITRAGIPFTEAHLAAAPLAKAVAMNKFRPGDKITVNYTESSDKLLSLAFNAPNDKKAKVKLVGDSYVATVLDRPLKEGRGIAVGHIKGSLYQAANKAGLPAALVPDFANLFSYDVDFTREVKEGDVFRVVFEETRDENGEYLRSGNILAAEFYASGKKYAAYRFKDDFGSVEYFNDKGETKKKLLMRTPLEFTRISSHFNPNRKHPILGYTRAHRGTDFAAPTGTPVKASGNGEVVAVKLNGAHGKYVKIRHNGTYSTSYSHLSRYAKNLRPGQTVKQGQVIAYVGTTGRSTGPHLHYEVHVNGQQVNALSTKLPTGSPLSRGNKAAFNYYVANIQKLWAAAETKLASTETPTKVR